MRVLVTGASSLIGSGVARALAARGEAVVCFQRRRVDELAGIEGITQELGDVRDAPALLRAAAHCNAIVHLAAKVGEAGECEAFTSINVGGTKNVIAAARAHDISRLVHVSTPSVAHVGEPIIGDSATAPATGRKRAWYAESKAVAELYALAAASPDLGVVAIRPHLVWGPGDTQLVGRIVDRARQGRLALVGGGRALIDTTYITNAVDVLVSALDAVQPRAACSGKAYVIANGEPRPIRDLVGGICRAAGVEFAPRDVPLGVATRAGSVLERVWSRLPNRLRAGEAEPPLTRFVAEQLGTAHWFDPRPARDDLGWVPRISIDEGLDLLTIWFAEIA